MRFRTIEKPYGIQKLPPVRDNLASNKNPRPSPSGSPWGWSLSEALKPQGSFELGGNLFPKKYLKKKEKKKKEKKNPDDEDAFEYENYHNPNHTY